MNLTKEKLVEEMDSSFVKLALEDIKRSLDANTNLAVFILGACFIDALAGFYSGKEDTKPGGDGKRFKDFVKKYLKQYGPEDLWKNLRCGLVHSYVTEKHSFTNKKSDQHRQLTPKKLLENINDQEFYDDLKKAYDEFKNDILDDSDTKIFDSAQKRYKALKIMKISLIKDS